MPANCPCLDPYPARGGLDRTRTRSAHQVPRPPARDSASTVPPWPKASSRPNPPPPPMARGGLAASPGPRPQGGGGEARRRPAPLCCRVGTHSSANFRAPGGQNRVLKPELAPEGRWRPVGARDHDSCPWSGSRGLPTETLHRPCETLKRPDLETIRVAGKLPHKFVPRLRCIWSAGIRLRAGTGQFTPVASRACGKGPRSARQAAGSHRRRSRAVSRAAADGARANGRYRAVRGASSDRALDRSGARHSRRHLPLQASLLRGRPEPAGRAGTATSGCRRFWTPR